MLSEVYNSEATGGLSMATVINPSKERELHNLSNRRGCEAYFDEMVPPNFGSHQPTEFLKDRKRV
jgi:hypothetical protein